MIAGKKILAFIPARRNSKGIRLKNIIPLNGKPLIAYSIEAAKASKYVDAVVVSTDGEDIAEVAKQYGAEVPFMRPEQFATDHATISSAAMHAFKTLEGMGRTYDVFLLLQPTQPLRTVADIDGALELFIEKGEKSLASVSLVSDHPILIRLINEQGELVPMLNQRSSVRRQDMPPYYRINGCIYIIKVSDMTETTSLNDNMVAYIMEQSHSVDIDEMSDIALAEYYLTSINLIETG